MKINFRSPYRVVFAALIIVAALGLLIAPFTNASCSTTTTESAPADALRLLRAMAHSSPSPADETIVRLETQYPNTNVAALARLLRARLKVAQGDATTAARLLDSGMFKQQTAISDYALFARADALEKANRSVEARALYEQLARDYPNSPRARQATLRAAEILRTSGGAAGVPLLIKSLIERDDPAALALAALANEEAGDVARAVAAWRRLRFYAPAAAESKDAAALTRLGSSLAPATAEEAITRADKLFAARAYGDAADAYADSFMRFPATADPTHNLRRGIAATNSRRTNDAVAALRAVPLAATELHAQSLSTLALAYAKSRQYDLARGAAEELRRLHPTSTLAPRAYVSIGNEAKDAKNNTVALDFYRTAVSLFPGNVEVAGAQFEVAWAAHDAKNFPEASRLLTEHLALYADRNTDNRGRAGYWAARDSERAGRIVEARALYQGMLARYDANWYGYLARTRLAALSASAATQKLLSGSQVERAVANLKTVVTPIESVGREADSTFTRADQLTTAGYDEWALEELAPLSAGHADSPRVNLAVAQIYRASNRNVEALSALRRSYPDYSQMEPEELTREEWDVFYPLAYWNIIREQARARSLDPYTVAGLIRQESVFNPQAKSGANAYGLMQLLVPTAQALARRYSVDTGISASALYDPRLNIRLGTAYMRDQFNEFGRLEYVAAAYNAGPGRPRVWRNTLPAEIDEFAEAIPFRETRGYVQGVTRNMLQYRRLYDENGEFRVNVGAQRTQANNEQPSFSSTANNPATQPTLTATPSASDASSDEMRPRRTTRPEDEN